MFLCLWFYHIVIPFWYFLSGLVKTVDSGLHRVIDICGGPQLQHVQLDWAKKVDDNF